MSTARDDIVADTLSWLRTPYHHEGAVKAAGVDCAMLLVCVFRGRGRVPADLDPRPYPMQWHLHRGEERYLGWLEAFGRRVDTPQPGDVGVWQFGRTFSHGGIVVSVRGADIEIVHALKDAREVTVQLASSEPLAGRPVRWYTLMEGGA